MVPPNLSDLDDVLDEFSAPTSKRGAPSASSPPPPPPPAASSSSTPASSTTPAAFTGDDFPDPEDDALPDIDDLDPALVKNLEEGMKALFAGLGASGEGANGAADEEKLDDTEFGRMMNEMLGGGYTGLTNPTQGGATDPELRAMLDSLGIGSLAAEMAKGTDAPATPSASSAKGKAPAVPSAFLPPHNPAAPANFQDAIAASMSKMRDSSSSANAAAESSRAAGAGGDAGMAAMLAQLAGMPDLGDLAGDDEEGLQGMLDEMMKQLMSREMLYEPLKDLADKYPEYLAQHGSSLPSEDLERYKKQEAIVRTIVGKFDEPGADKKPPLSPAEEEQHAKRMDEVVELVAKMNECGAPPKELMGDMPPGMELGSDGVPKLPECTIA
ncbi:Peroxisome chaperone and import receptor [Rhodosporidiobolus nylandii]